MKEKYYFRCVGYDEHFQLDIKEAVHNPGGQASLTGRRPKTKSILFRMRCKGVQTCDVGVIS